ncbi:hypothetical protein FSARC_13755 [Fusarium sarcochroum]|uniref:Sulphur transport domain-containing protein n=1 Tax=Fusarium sarcochroum TaxID=1208366 RepID=A0A8H4WSL5_9HYPO|nr:hypothetical protein FSARC_13755 [Fusarium sarcochroum]
MGSLLSGVIFGTGLTLSGVASPQVIKNQFQLSDFHMLATFLTASASSAAIFSFYNLRGPEKKIATKQPSSHGWFGSYDGNIIGGAMIGLGMSLTGACPGTVLVQAVSGTGNSRLLAGSVLFAGILWVKLKPYIIGKPAKNHTGTASAMQATGWSAKKAVLSYEAILISAIAATLALAPRSQRLLHPVVGGLLIGLGQLSSVVFTDKPVGVSSAYEEAGKLFWDVVNGKNIKLSSISDSIVFACGILAGSWLTMLNVPAAREALARSGEQPLLSILIGGFLLVFGARTAGGCTSGHGISGMASMGLSSFVTVACMFGTGLLAGSFLP